MDIWSITLETENSMKRSDVYGNTPGYSAQQAVAFLVGGCRFDCAGCSLCDQHGLVSQDSLCGGKNAV